MEGPEFVMFSAPSLIVIIRIYEDIMEEAWLH